MGDDKCCAQGLKGEADDLLAVQGVGSRNGPCRYINMIIIRCSLSRGGWMLCGIYYLMPVCLHPLMSLCVFITYVIVIPQNAESHHLLFPQPGSHRAQT